MEVIAAHLRAVFYTSSSTIPEDREQASLSSQLGIPVKYDRPM